jgi:sugar phosphate permease
MVFFVGSLTAVLGLWGNGYMKTVYQISNEKAAYYLSFITYGFIVGAPIVGKLSDLLGGAIKKILLFASSGYVLIWSYVLILQKGKPPVEQWPFIYFLMGILIICHILVFSNVKEINPLKYTGIATSLVNIGEFVGSGIISLLMGLMIKRLKLSGMPLEEVYTTAMVLVLGAAVLSLIAVLFMHQTSHKPIGEIEG